ncbi:MAG: tetratricopeptide repeat protein [Ardenticatenaceae bacterium]|nr:tetratricopeptide repeat protein [Ardenticatenaceae bacterium]
MKTHIEFHSLLCTYFNTNELRTLCFDLNINYENLPGNTFDSKTRELVAFCYRYERLEALIIRCRELRPIVIWPNSQALKESLEISTPDLQKGINVPNSNQTIHGSYNAVSSHGGNSTVNVTNIHHPFVEDSSSLLERSILLIQAHAYDQAIETLNSALKLTPENPRTHFYLAFAMLKGNRPKLLKLSTIQAIENHLQVAIDIDPKLGQAYILWSLLKYDYYVMNSIRESPPTIAQLLQQNWSVNQNEINEIKKHISAPRNRVWEWLQSL